MNTSKGVLVDTDDAIAISAIVRLLLQYANELSDSEKSAIGNYFKNQLLRK
jgi:hypothetical protein